MSAAFGQVADSPAIEGLSNFRDFGGHATASGARVMVGRLYRSANLAGLTSVGLAQFAALGIGRVVDLRGSIERLNAMPPFEDGAVTIVSTPVEPRISGPIRALLASGEATSGQLRDLMIESYRAYVTEAAEIFGQAVEAIATAGEQPVLVHCTAGKDRTGFIVALLQRALGASEDAVMLDYLRTNADWDRASVKGHLPLDHEAIQPILVADADYLAVAFDEIAARDGSIAAFIDRATSGRVTGEHLAALLEKEPRS
jgi:protein-tyrosine phosphatase